MDEPISAADANRRFSQLLRGVREDHTTYVVTSHGKPVAKITPVDAAPDMSEHAHKVLLARLKAKTPVLNAGHWKRDELYEDEE